MNEKKKKVVVRNWKLWMEVFKQKNLVVFCLVVIFFLFFFTLVSCLKKKTMINIFLCSCVSLCFLFLLFFFSRLIHFLRKKNNQICQIILSHRLQLKRTKAIQMVCHIHLFTTRWCQHTKHPCGVKMMKMEEVIILLLGEVFILKFFFFFRNDLF